MARYSDVRKVYSIDVNPCAVRYMQDNIRLNRACAKMVCLHDDAKEIVETNLHNAGDMVPMPLPEKNPLLYAMSIVSPQGGWRSCSLLRIRICKKEEGGYRKSRVQSFQEAASLERGLQCYIWAHSQNYGSKLVPSRFGCLCLRTSRKAVWVIADNTCGFDERVL